MKKIFILLSFFFIFSFFNTPKTNAAAVDCGISPDSVIESKTTQDFIIGSGGTEPNTVGNLPTDQAVDVIISYEAAGGGPAVSIPLFESRDGSLSTNKASAIHFTANLDATRLQAFRNQSINVWVYKHDGNRHSPQDSLCKTLRIKILPATFGGAFCDPLNITAVDPDGNKFPLTQLGTNNGHPKPNDKIELHPKIPDASTPGFGDNDTHNIYLNDTLVKTVKTPALDGFTISPQSTGQYRIDINNSPAFDNPLNRGANQCFTQFTVGPAGGGIITPQGTIACPYCPSDTSWNNQKQKCIKTNGEEVDPNNEPCPQNSVCVPGHTETSTARSVCSPLTNPINYDRSDYTRNDLCPSSQIKDGTCKAIPSGLGVDLPTQPDKLINKILAIFLGIVGGLAILIIIFAGYRLMVSQGNPEKIQTAREQLIAAIVGFLFVIFSVVILQVIGYNILGIPGFNP